MQDTAEPSTVAKVIEKALAERHIPSATYRLQFNRNFTFGYAEEMVAYLYELGISDCYASPLLKARPQSDHGYDVTDHASFNPVIGTPAEFYRFSDALITHGMGLILDIVPNHMGIGHESNLWWMDVLENGPSSSYSEYFDIDWHPVKPEMENKLLIPTLGNQYGNELESGKLRLTFEDGAFFIYYYDIKFPVAPRSYSMILNYPLESLTTLLGKDHQDLQEYLSILTALNYLPLRTDLTPQRLEERAREKEIIKRRLINLYKNNVHVEGAIRAALEAFNGRVGEAASFDLLDQLINEQAYRPAFWRVAAEQINYRRFFDVNELAALRVERPEVFQASHQLVFRLLAEGRATGLRIDHPDGLWNPTSYFRQLQENYLLNRALAQSLDVSADEAGKAISAWFTAEVSRARRVPCWPLYVVAEKILSEYEPLPKEWAIYGTSGYDFLITVNGLFVDSANSAVFEKIYSGFIREQIDYRELTDTAKQMIMKNSLTSEIYSLSHQLERLAEKNRRYRDFTLDSLTLAIREIIACLPIYRTYIIGPHSVTERDRHYIEVAVATAKKRNPRTAEPIFDFIRDTLLLYNLQNFRAEDQPKLLNWVMKFQQVTGPVMAKGLEDTAFYIYNRLVSLNEVGGNPAEFGVSVREFHHKNGERQQYWPHAMTATSTHDTKRSEDVRARINVLSEIPGEWKAALNRWKKINAGKKTVLDGKAAPSSNDEYLLYQTLLGAWPDEPITREAYANFTERIISYMQKATKEAKVHTSWINPNNDYDAAVRIFVQRVLNNGGKNAFLKDLCAFQKRIAYFGRFNALSQLLLKLVSPGVPDIYQGTELWDLSLVDPDNRRPVDYARRREMLRELKLRVDADGKDLSGLALELLNSSEDARIKFYITYCLLNLRRQRQELFLAGDYTPIAVEGDKSEHVCAFIRRYGNEAIIAVVPRLLLKLCGGEMVPPVGAQVWKQTRLIMPFPLKSCALADLFTGKSIDSGSDSMRMSEVLEMFPVALLFSSER